MNTLQVLKSRGVAYLVILLVLIDLLLLFVATGFGSWVAVLVLEAIVIFYYVITRSVVDVDEPFFLFKSKSNGE